jgi:hypothetical protein
MLVCAPGLIVLLNKGLLASEKAPDAPGALSRRIPERNEMDGNVQPLPAVAFRGEAQADCSLELLLDRFLDWQPCIGCRRNLELRCFGVISPAPILGLPFFQFQGDRRPRVPLKVVFQLYIPELDLVFLHIAAGKGDCKAIAFSACVDSAEKEVFSHLAGHKGRIRQLQDRQLRLTRYDIRSRPYDMISVPYHTLKAYITARRAISCRRHITRSARNGYHCKKLLCRSKGAFCW